LTDETVSREVFGWDLGELVLVEVEKIVVIVEGFHVGLMFVNKEFILFVLDFLCLCLGRLGVVVI
jgi:hypothetical protein